MKIYVKNLLDAKTEMQKSQFSFQKSLKENFPCLTSVDLSTLESKMERELEYLLSSAIVIKSGRIHISAPGFRYMEKLVFTRDPGLKAPYSSYRAFDLFQIISVEPNGDLMKKSNYDGSAGLIETSILKDHKHIDQEKLEKFYELLKIGLKWKKHFVDLMIPTNDKHEYKVGSNEINLSPYTFSIGLRIPNKDDNNTERSMNLDLKEMVAYEKDYDQKSIRNQEYLKMFLKDYDDFDSILRVLEKKKIDLVAKGNVILEKVKEYNKPFRILETLKKSAI